MTLPEADAIRSMEELEQMLAAPASPSRRKETDYVTPAYRRMIEASPFLALATAGPEGLDCSPRGDAAGFVRVADERTLLIPERRGNNRADSLRNLVRDGRMAVLFLVPGAGETLRVNGRAELTRNHEVCESFAVDGVAPKIVIVVHVESVYFQCARAIVRSHLWDSSRHRGPGEVPSAGAMLADATRGEEGGAAYDAQLSERIPKTLY